VNKKTMFYWPMYPLHLVIEGLENAAV